MRLGSVVDWEDLGKAAAYSIAAGVGIALAFSLTLLGFIRSHESRNDDQAFEALAWGALGVVALAVSLGGVIWGLFVIADKS